MAIRSQFSTGLVAAGENEWIAAPPEGWQKNGTRKGIVWAHPWNGAVTGVDDPDSGAVNQYYMIRDLAEDFIVLTADLGLNTWGNATGVSRVGAARSYLVNTWGCTSVGLVGVSMGALNLLNYWKANPALVAFMALVEPAIDINDVYSAATNTQTSINAAYPAAYNNATHGPTSNPGVWIQTAVPSTTTPMKLWTASDDPTARPAAANAFLTRRPTTERMDLGAVGHSEAAIGVANPDVLAWCKQFK